MTANARRQEPHAHPARPPRTNVVNEPPQNKQTQSARRIPASEQRGIWEAYARGKFREGQRLQDATRIRRALEDGKEQLGRMNYFHAVREKKEELERAAAAGMASSTTDAHHHYQQRQPPERRRRRTGRPHHQEGEEEEGPPAGEGWDLSAFLQCSLPGVAPADLARYEAGMREEGFGDGRGEMLVYLKEGDLTQWKWKKAHARAFLAAVRREVGSAEEGKGGSGGGSG